MLIGIDASRANRNYKTGTEWYSYYLIKNLAEIDNDNRYFLYTDKPLVGGLSELIESHKNFKEKYLKWPFQYFWTLGRLSLQMSCCRPRVLFVPAHAMPLIHPRRTITTIHDIAFKKEKAVYAEQTVDRGQKFLRRLIIAIIKHYFLLTTGKFKYDATAYLDWSTKFALKHARKVITVSQFTKDEIIATYKVNPDKIIVIHNGYNNLLYKPLDNKAKIKMVLDKYGLEGDYFLYVGRLEKKKNISALIEAFAIMRENNKEIKTKLVLIGHAGFGYDELKYVIEEFNLNNDVIMLGWVEEADMTYIYNAAKAFVFPSRHEGFGIPVIQSLACGVPTVVSDIPVLREVAEDAVLYFDKDDKYDMAAKLKQIVVDEDLRRNLIKKGLERAKNFSWKKCAAETLKAINSL